MNNVVVKSSIVFNNVQQCVIKFPGVTRCNKSPYIVHYHYNISSSPSVVMTTKTNVGLFLMTGLVLAVAALYSLPMQQATACGGSCDGGDKCCDGGSLVNVETGDNDIGYVYAENTNIGNVKTGDIASKNFIKAFNNNKIGNVKDVNVLSKNYLKDVNVLSKNNNNKFLNNILSDSIDDVIHYYDENDNVKVPIVSGNTLNAFKLLGCGC